MVSARGNPRQYLAYTTRFRLSPTTSLKQKQRAKALSPANGLSFKGNTDAALNMGYNLVILRTAKPFSIPAKHRASLTCAVSVLLLSLCPNLLLIM